MSDLNHDPNCDYWCDQYPDECTCGLTRPTAKGFVPHDNKREIVLDLLAHLVAAVSLLERSPKTAAPSNRMFDQMIVDYQRAINRGRAYLKTQEIPAKPE